MIATADNSTRFSVVAITDCMFEVEASVSNAWGYAGGAFSLAILGVPGLTEVAAVNGYGSGGDIIGRQLVAHKVFSGGKKGAEYKFSFELAAAGGFSNGTLVVKQIAV